MPHKKKKQFIDPKHSVTFGVVYRGQDDPLAVDDTAPTNVLVPKFDKSLNSAFLKDDSVNGVARTRIEERRKFGIYFEDDYDYLQHIRDVRGPAIALFEPRTKTQQVLLPSSVFPASIPAHANSYDDSPLVTRPDFDADVAAALDEPGSDDDLEDDFVVLAGGQADEGDGFKNEEHFLMSRYLAEPCDKPIHAEFDEMNAVEYDRMGVPNHARVRFDSDTANSGFGKASRFTEYSLTSSVMRRSVGLTNLDSEFEHLYEEYDSDDIGALDGEEIVGGMDMEELLKRLTVQEDDIVVPYVPVKEPRRRRVTGSDGSDDGSDHDDAHILMPVGKRRPDFDCESILSLYSNLYNHPTRIKEPKKGGVVLSNKTGIPMDVLPRHDGLTKRQGEKLQHDETKNKLLVSVDRSRGETQEERRNRKLIVKQFRKERRVEKKATKLAFKDERLKQSQCVLNAQQNLAGIQLS